MESLNNYKMLTSSITFTNIKLISSFSPQVKKFSVFIPSGKYDVTNSRIGCYACINNINIQLSSDTRIIHFKSNNKDKLCEDNELIANCSNYSTEKKSEEQLDINIIMKYIPLLTASVDSIFLFLDAVFLNTQIKFNFAETTNIDIHSLMSNKFLSSLVLLSEPNSFNASLNNGTIDSSLRLMELKKSLVTSYSNKKELEREIKRQRINHVKIFN